MKPKTMILMVLAVACGLGASFMTSRLLAERQGQDEQKEQVKILVAKKNLDMGLIVKQNADLFDEKSFAKGEEPKDGIVVPDNQFKQVVDQLKGRAFKISRRTGDVIALDHMFDQKDSGLQGILPEGYRAVGIRVNMETIAGGFAALPHSRVDIISTVRRGSDRDSFSRILLENVLVLAADTTSQRDNEGKAMPANVVTVALKPDEMLKVNMAKDIGTLSLALRRFGDGKGSNVGKVTVENILSGNSSGLKEDAADDDGPDGLGGPNSLPSIARGGKTAVPAVPTLTPADVAAAQRAKYGSHVLTVIEGPNERRTSYATNEKGEVVPQEVIRSELENAPVQTPRATPTTPRTPAPPAVEGSTATNGSLCKGGE